MTQRQCTAIVTNRGRRFLHKGRQSRWVTVLDVRVVDAETGEVLNEVVVHSAKNDTVTLKGCYEVKTGD